MIESQLVTAAEVKILAFGPREAFSYVTLDLFLGNKLICML